MSVMQKIFGAFSGSPQPQNPQQQQQQPITNNLNTNPAPPSNPPSPGTAPNGTVPPGGGDPPNNQPASPMEKFGTLWETPPTDPNAPQPDQPIDPQKLMEAAAKVDFSKIVSAEDMAAISGGGDGAAQALVKLLNTTAQTVYGQSAVTTARIVEAAVSKARDQFTAEIPGLLKRQTARDAIFQENPAFNNPAIAPMIEAHAAQLATKFPKASPQELKAMSQEYFLGMANLINPPKTVKSQNPGTGTEEDWTSYMAD